MTSRVSFIYKLKIYNKINPNTIFNFVPYISLQSTNRQDVIKSNDITINYTKYDSISIISK